MFLLKSKLLVRKKEISCPMKLFNLFLAGLI